MSFLIFITFCAVIAVRLFVLEIYKIPSNSMNPTLLSGDYVLVSKIDYGPRIINMWKLVFSKEAEYIWLKGFDKIKKNDVIVFNYPQYEYLEDSVAFIYGTPLIKRCFGIAGDSIQIRKDGSGMTNSQSIYSNLFPYDTSLHWNANNYGPLYVPRKGDTLALIPQNVRHYHDVLLYENIGIQISNDSVFVNGIYIHWYCFKYNYYFMLGDNFYQSRDSRFWGFLPETHIIGKAVLVLFSLDQEAPWYKKFRWRRFLKRIV
jgi:signal peptidase I